MSTTSFAAAEARTVLAQNEEEQKELKRAQQIAQLATIRTELRTKQAVLNALPQKIADAQNDLDNTRRHLLAVSDELSTLEHAKPEMAEYLPTDPEVVEWNARRADLEAKLGELRAQRAGLPNVELMRIEGVNLHRRVGELVYAESNLLNQLKGTHAQVPPGGVFGVL